MWNRIKALRVLLPKGVVWQKALLGATGVGLLAIAFCFGWWMAPPRAGATPPDTNPTAFPTNPIVHPPTNPTESLAYIYGRVPITRQDYGNYLIERMDSSRLEFMVNRRIIEMECRRRGIVISHQAVEAQLIHDLKVMNIPNIEGFVQTVLKRFGKSLYEYMEDVIRPKLALRRLCAPHVKVTPKDLKEAHEAKYGPKVQCRMIVFPKEQNDRSVEKIWQVIVKSEKEFNYHATHSNIAPLNANGGKVPPVHMHFPDKQIEKVAFALKPGEVSRIIQLEDGSHVVLKCDEHLKPITNRPLTQKEEVQQLEREVYERKMLMEIPKLFKHLKTAASPKIHLRKGGIDPKLARRVNVALRNAAVARQGMFPGLPKAPDVKPRPQFNKPLSLPSLPQTSVPNNLGPSLERPRIGVPEYTSPGGGNPVSGQNLPAAPSTKRPKLPSLNFNVPPVPDKK